MQIRAVTGDDLADVLEIDGTVESSAYLHVETNVGDGIKASWLLEERKNRQKLIDPNRLGDDASFFLKQVVARVEEGLALTIEHEETPVALLLARPEVGNGTLRIIDLRVDYDYRRQGMGTALVYQAIAQARELKARAVSAQTLTNNTPAADLLAKCGFELSGVDTRRRTNHDLVKEAVTLFWYAPLD